MFLLDDQNTIVNAECSLDLFEGASCVVVESSGGTNPALGAKRRNPDYNKLLNLILGRLAHSGAEITRVVLDSSKVASVPVEDRIAKLDRPYPVDLSVTNNDEFRTMLQREISPMLSLDDSKRCGLEHSQAIAFSERSRHYMQYHRAFQFKCA